MSVKRTAARLAIGAALLGVGLGAGGSQQYIEISAAGIDLRNGGARAKADWLRYKLVELNGPTGGYILAPGHGDQRGYLGTINALTGGQFLGPLLRDAGIDDCAAIPTLGEVRGQVTLDDGQLVSSRAQFGEGTRLLPAHHHGQGKRYGKQIVVYADDVPILEIQLSCPDDQGFVSGYFYRPADAENDRPREVYFQQNQSTGDSRLDFYMTHPPSGEHYAFRFASEGTLVQIWNIRAMVHDQTSSGFAAAYLPAEGLALTGFLLGAHDPTDSTSLADSDEQCVSLISGEGADGCGSRGLTITAPSDTADVGGRTHPFTIAGIAAMAIRSDGPVREREAMPSDAGVPPAGSDAAPLDQDDGSVPGTEANDAGIAP